MKNPRCAAAREVLPRARVSATTCIYPVMLRHSLPFLLLFTLAGSFVYAADYDLVIRGGQLIDGTGKPAAAADLAVLGNRVAAIGIIKETGRTEIDAAGQVVAPGFIDVHTHSEDIASLPVAENFLRMGVTTIVTGNCGGSKLEVAAFFEAIRKTGVALNVATLIGH